MKSFTTRLLCLATIALGVAGTAFSYDVTLTDNFSVNGTQLKAGDYKIEMQGDMAVFTKGEKSVQLRATLGKSDQPYSSTVFVSQRSKLLEIDLGGTQDKIVFASASK
jgi:hypothetical protein